ncbi:hypothetical protein [Paracoccus salipaludis]|uniref:hypothetical protein n=1 Tax=Paracoccus salipaludis TaxID=2032623 RepID=UPI001071B224|nr:hypothetical protein [Paracoccus salipaludis]
MSEAVCLKDFKTEQDATITNYQCLVLGYGDRRKLHYEISSTTGHPHPSITANWAILGMLLPAMRTGKTLRCDHGVSALLLHFLRTDLQELLINFDPSLSRIDIDADALPPDLTVSKDIRIGTGFSAGIDSFNSLGVFCHSDTTSQLNVTDLFIFDVGAFGQHSSKSSRNSFTAAAGRTRSYADRLGLHAHSVTSNLADFYVGASELDFIRTHTLRNASAAVLFEREIDIYLYASAFSYREVDLKAKYALGHIDSILLSLITTTQLRFISSGAGSDRIKKTALLSNDKDAQHMLDVCVTPTPRRSTLVGVGRNCSRCWKCYRTMVTLDALGRLEEFRAVFDVDRYFQHREAIFSQVHHRGAKGSSIDQAAANLLLERGLAPSPPYTRRRSAGRSLPCAST